MALKILMFLMDSRLVTQFTRKTDYIFSENEYNSYTVINVLRKASSNHNINFERVT